MTQRGETKRQASDRFHKLQAAANASRRAAFRNAGRGKKLLPPLNCERDAQAVDENDPRFIGSKVRRS